VLYLGGLYLSFTPKHLPPLLEGYKLDSILLYTDKACAFLHFETVEEALKARVMLRANLPANIAFGKKESTPYPNRNIFVDCIDPSLSVEEITHEFSKYAVVQGINKSPKNESAIFTFASTEDAGKVAKNMQSKLLGKHKIQIFFVKPAKAINSLLFGTLP